MKHILKKAFLVYLTIGIPLLYLYNIYLAYAFPNTLKLPSFANVVGILFALLGIAIWIISYVNLGWSFGVLPQKQKRVTTGLYTYFKHPMYIGICLTFLGLSLSNASLQGLLFLCFIILPILFVRAHTEDKLLK